MKNPIERECLIPLPDWTQRPLHLMFHRFPSAITSGITEGTEEFS